LRAVVTGGAGFLGSHLSGRLLDEGWDVVCVDSFLTGATANLEELSGRRGWSLTEQDVSAELRVEGSVDCVLHFASPASPVDYLMHPLETLKVGSLGTLNCLELAVAKGALFLLASTSEVYGDPQVHPQPETYWGHVNPVGPRAVYDEAKRFAEALTTAYATSRGVRAKIVRIFNTYGPKMRLNDGRAVPTFIHQALAGQPLTIHGTGGQTRSLCYVSDLIEGIWRLLNSSLPGPVNLGSDKETSILELARIISSLAEVELDVVHTERPLDDPELRRPDLTLARRELAWEPTVSLGDGLATTLEWARLHWFSNV
jgi:dTDP-glucose 4,6-dehydratase